MDILEKNFDISNTIEVDELAKRWGVRRKQLIIEDIEGKVLAILRLVGRYFMI